MRGVTDNQDMQDGGWGGTAILPTIAVAIGLLAPATMAEAADVNVTSDTTRVDLDTKVGTTVDIASGVTIKNNQPTLTAGTVQATTQAWTLTNNGKIDGRQDDSLLTNDGVKFTKGGVVNNTATGAISGFYGVFTSGSTGTVNNSGSITGFLRGVEMQAGGSVTNNATGTITNVNGAVNIIGGAGTVVNSGTISSTSANAVSINGGGSVTNNLGANLTGSSGIVIQNGLGTVINNGTITGTKSVDTVALRGGTVTNTGTITGTTGSNVVSIVQIDGGLITNSGTITNLAASSFATGVDVQNGTVNNQAGGLITGYYNAVYLPGSKGSTLINAGTLKSTANTAGSGAVEMNSGGTVTNEATGIILGQQQGILNTAGAITLTNKGSITGTSAAALQLNGTGVSAVTNYGTISGAVNLSTGDGTLNVFTGSSITGAVDARAGTDTLRLQGSGTGSYNGTYANFEAFDVDAAGGTWTFTGTQAFANGSTLTNGTLNVGGNLGGALNVKSGATLKGTGTVGTTTIAGTVAPGNSIGTLNVGGDLSIVPGSTYQVELDNTGATDLIAATGKAAISGGSIQVLATAGKYNASQEYVIITAPGGVSGSGFTGVSTNMAFLTPTVRYDPTQVVLTLKISSIDFASVAQTKNQTEVGNGVQALGPGNPIWDAILPLSAPDARAALDALNGEIYPAALGALMDDSRHVREATLDHLRSLDDILPDHPVNVWMEGYLATGDVESTAGTAAFERGDEGVLVGVDVLFGEIRVGVLGGYGRADIDVNSRGSSAQFGANHIGAYAAGRFGPVALRAGLDFANYRSEVQRRIAFTGYIDQAGATPGAEATQAFVEIGYNWDLGRTRLEPFASLTAVSVEMDAISETGGGARLSSPAESDNVTLGTLGIRGAGTLMEGEDGKLTLRAAIAYRRALEDVAPSRRFTFGGTGTAFRVVAAPPDRDTGLVEAGAEWRAPGGGRAGLYYSGEFSEGATTHGGRLAISFPF